MKKDIYKQLEKKFYCPKHGIEMEWEGSSHGGGGCDPLTKEVLARDSKDKIISFLHARYRCPKKYCRNGVSYVVRSGVVNVGNIFKGGLNE